MPKSEPAVRYAAANIRSLRVHLGMTRSELAKRAGLSVSGVIKIEGGSDMRLSTFCRVARALEIPPMILLTTPPRDARKRV